MSSGKGITFDGFSDTWFKYTKKTNILRNWWNNDTLLLLDKYIFRARLIPLNKVYPEIPRYNQFRPIVVLSAAYKYLEARFLPAL